MEEEKHQHAQTQTEIAERHSDQLRKLREEYAERERALEEQKRLHNSTLHLL